MSHCRRYPHTHPQPRVPHLAPAAAYDPAAIPDDSADPRDIAAYADHRGHRLLASQLRRMILERRTDLTDPTGSRFVSLSPCGRGQGPALRSLGEGG